MAPADDKRSRRPEFADDVQASTGGEVKRILPSHIRADHTRNGRWAPYDTPAELVPYLGPKCCFTLAQIEQRLASLKSEGQLEHVTVSVSNTGKPDLEIGYLRHAAGLLAEVRGELEQIPGAKGTKFAGLLCKVVAAPKSQSEHLALARKNLAENRERQALSPVDLAFYVRRRLDSFDDAGKNPTIPEVAAELGMSERALARYRQLLSLEPSTLLAVHEGRMSMAAALSKASERGQGTAQGARPGITHKTIRRGCANMAVNTKARPSKSPSPEQLVKLFAVIAGDADAKELDDIAAEWLDRLTPPKDQTSTASKKAPKSKRSKDDAEECDAA